MFNINNWLSNIDKHHKNLPNYLIARLKILLLSFLGVEPLPELCSFLIGVNSIVSLTWVNYNDN